MPVFWALGILLFLQSPIITQSFQYKVGDLDSWGLPPPSRSHLYSSWSQTHHFKIGDSLLFLYPPSQDSVIQVTERAYNTCITSDPLRKMADGNSVFNITSPGIFYFISGEKGHCGKGEKIQIAVPSADGKFFPPSASDPGSPAGAPSYPTVFGPMPMGMGSGSGSGSAAGGSLAVGRVVWAVGSLGFGAVVSLVL